MPNSSFDPGLVPSRRPKLTHLDVEYMLATAIRRREMFQAARSRLRSEQFGPAEKEQRIIWAAARDFFEQHGHLANRVTLKVWAASRASRDESCTPQDIESLCARIDALFSVPLDTLEISVALGFLRRFLEDRLTLEMADALQSEDSPSDFFAFLQNVRTRASDISVLTEEGVEETFPENWSIGDDRLEVTSTGLPFLDYYLGGGMAPGEVALLLGAFGSRKSLLGLQLAIEQAQFYYSEWVENGRQGPLKQVYFLSYEDPKQEVRLRTISCAATIPWETVMRGDQSVLSTAQNLKPYERELFAEALAAGQQVGGERERVAAAAMRLNRNFFVVDMSGRDDRHPNRGCGYVEEIRQLLEADLRKPRPDGIPRAVGLVVLDYIKVCVARYIQNHPREKLENTFHYVNKFPYFFKHEVLVPFGASGMLLQQVDAQSQQKLVTNHAQSSEGKSVGENANFCFGLGTPDSAGMQTLSCTKARRVAVSPARILTMHPYCMRLEDVSDRYSYDKASGKIVLKSEFALVDDLDVNDVRAEFPDQGDENYGDIYDDY